MGSAFFFFDLISEFGFGSFFGWDGIVTSYFCLQTTIKAFYADFVYCTFVVLMVISIIIIIQN